MDGAQVVGMLIGLVIGLTIGVLIGAVILRAAVALYNKLAGTPGGVPDPPFGKAMLIVFVTCIANMVAGFAVGLVTGFGAAAANAEQKGAELTAQLISLPVGFLVMAGMLMLMLPTSFGKALLVAVCQIAICIVIGIALFAVIFVASMVLSSAR